jgi:beta-phosphoglucomutase
MKDSADLQMTGRAALWDMDGTLIDSLEYHWLSWRDALAAENFPITREQFMETFGQRNMEIMRHYFGPDVDLDKVERVSNMKEELYRELVRNRGIEPLPGVRRWLAHLKKEGWRQTVASSAPILNIEVVLEAMEAVEFFDAIVSAEEVERGKPDPQVFLRAAAKVSTPPEMCVVIEDAPSGVEAARRAGMRRIGVLSSHPSLEADIVVKTLDELPDDAFDSLLK